MTKLESGNLWHALSLRFVDKYHNGESDYRYRYGFDISKLSTSELHQYALVYTATMQARGQHQGIPNIFNRYLKDLQSSNRKTF